MYLELEDLLQITCTLFTQGREKDMRKKFKYYIIFIRESV